MSIAISLPVVRKNDRLFFSGMALASAVISFHGFLPTYFHRSAELPPLTPLYQLHGAVFTAWIVLLVVQTSLVAGGRADIHRKLGMAGVILAAVVFGLALRCRSRPCGETVCFPSVLWDRATLRISSLPLRSAT